MSVRKLRHDRPSGRFSKSWSLSASVSFLSSPPLPAPLLGPFVARSLTLIPRSLLLNRTETLATQAMKVVVDLTNGKSLVSKVFLKIGYFRQFAIMHTAMASSRGKSRGKCPNNPFDNKLPVPEETLFDRALQDHLLRKLRGDRDADDIIRRL